MGPASAASSSSARPSPVVAAMGGVTPLQPPSPSADSPSTAVPTVAPDGVLVTSTGETIEAAFASQSKLKSYAALPLNTTESISECKSDPMLLPPKRMVAVSGSHAKTGPARGHGGGPLEGFDGSPKPSESLGSAAGPAASVAATTAEQQEFFEAYGRDDQRKRRWRAVKLLGQGTFSRVMLATSQAATRPAPPNRGDEVGTASRLPTPQRCSLVAVKVCEHGPHGGASADYIEESLKREVDIMKSIRHPSLVHLKAWNMEPARAILVLSYCSGGDLFDVASAHRDALTPALLRRMFAETVGAVAYLHERSIVHMDLKLENVLVNLPRAELLSSTIDWATYPYSVITVTDLGLSRRISDDEKLEARCGSQDYAAPEVILGQPYDGRATDAWSLGVLLYALLEGRLPFDPLPGLDPATEMHMRSRTGHRIARVEWRWVNYGVRDDDPAAEDEAEGDHEADPRLFEPKGLRGAIKVVEGLLQRARSRWALARVADTEWVREGIRVEGRALKFREENDGEEVI